MSHAAEGSPCQDHCRARVLGGGADSAIIACVADGAGYSEQGDVGSEIACESVAESLTTYYEQTGSFADVATVDVLRWCETARSKIEEHAGQSGRNLRDYATTLCAGSVSARGSVFFQIGDGAIILRKNGVLGAVFWPQSGEYVNTTNFLTSPEFREQLQIFTTAYDFSDLALFTDGIERLALRFDTMTPHPPFFQPLFQALRAASDVEGLGAELRDFLESESVRNKNDDDKTLVLASRATDPSAAVQ